MKTRLRPGKITPVPAKMVFLWRACHVAGRRYFDAAQSLRRMAGMSRQEERTYRVARKKLGVAELKAQRERLRQDLEQFASRKPDAAVISSLKERLKGLDAEIAAAEAERKSEGERGDGENEGGSGRYSPRGWIVDR
jgi:uncharacterized membrane protein YccC